MGLFSSLFGNEGAEKAAEVAEQTLAWQKQMAAEDQARRDAIVKGLQPNLDYSAETDKGIIESSLQDAATARGRSQTLWDEYMSSVMPMQQKFYREAFEYGGLADQERAAGTAISDVRQQYGIQQGINQRNLASMGINPNSGRFAATNRATELAAMAAAAGGATKARNTARDTGIQLRKDATTIGQSLGSGSQDYTRLNLGANQLASGLTNNIVNRGLAVGNFQSGGVPTYMSNVGASGNSASNALANTDSGLLPGLIGLGASVAMAPSTSWIGKKLT